MTDDAILAQLDALIASDDEGLLDTPEKPLPVTETDRLQRAFQEVVEFYEKEGREPAPETTNISERKLGARLTGIRASNFKIEALEDMDTYGLLATEQAPTSVDDLLNSDPLGLIGNAGGIFDTSSLPQKAGYAD